MSSYLPLITGSGGALIVLALWVYAFVSGKIHSDREYTKVETDSARKDEVIERLQEALDLERQRGNDVAQAGAVTNKFIGAMVAIATDRREHAGSGHDGLPAGREASPLDLTAKDLGL